MSYSGFGDYQDYFDSYYSQQIPAWERPTGTASSEEGVENTEDGIEIFENNDNSTEGDIFESGMAESSQEEVEPTATPRATTRPFGKSKETEAPTSTPEPTSAETPVQTKEPAVTTTTTPAVTPTSTSTPEPTTTQRATTRPFGTTEEPTSTPEPTSTETPVQTKEPAVTTTTTPAVTPTSTSTPEPTTTPRATTRPFGTTEAQTSTPDPTSTETPTQTPASATEQTAQPERTKEGDIQSIYNAFSHRTENEDSTYKMLEEIINKNIYNMSLDERYQILSALSNNYSGRMKTFFQSTTGMNVISGFFLDITKQNKSFDEIKNDVKKCNELINDLCDTNNDKSFFNFIKGDVDINPTLAYNLKWGVANLFSKTEKANDFEAINSMFPISETINLMYSTHNEQNGAPGWTTELEYSILKKIAPSNCDPMLDDEDIDATNYFFNEFNNIGYNDLYTRIIEEYNHIYSDEKYSDEEVQEFENKYNSYRVKEKSLYTAINNWDDNINAYREMSAQQAIYLLQETLFGEYAVDWAEDSGLLDELFGREGEALPIEKLLGIDVNPLEFRHEDWVNALEKYSYSTFPDGIEETSMILLCLCSLHSARDNNIGEGGHIPETMLAIIDILINNPDLWE